MLVDSHCHLDFPDFSEDFDRVLMRCNDNDVRVLQTICTKMADFPVIHRIAQDHGNIYCSVGVHPNHVHEAPLVTEEELIAEAQKPKVIGIGETGLDYYRGEQHKSAQQTSFRTHIQVSRATGLPLIVHTRNADEDTVNILGEETEQGVFPGLIHCFSTSHWLAEKCLELGFYISISGIVTFKNARALQDSVKKIPLERLLVETDAPYLAPVPHRGKRNEPAFTRHTAEYIAELKGVSYEDVARVTTENFFRLFAKAERPPDALN